MNQKIVRIFIVIISMLVIFNVIIRIPNFASSTDSFIVRINTSINEGADQVFDFFQNFNPSYVSYLEEQNELLTEQNGTLQSENEMLSSENEQLMTENDLKGNMDYEVISSARVIQYDNSGLNTILTIDVGRQDGIQLKMPVVNNGILIGYIAKVNEKTAQVQLYQNETINYTINCYAKDEQENINGYIDSYDEATKEYRFTLLDDSQVIKEGDYVYTNNYNENIPSGIKIGQITSIEGEGASQNIKIRSAIDISDYEYVSVIAL